MTNENTAASGLRLAEGDRRNGQKALALFGFLGP
jgi:hypothetical protein